MKFMKTCAAVGGALALAAGSLCHAQTQEFMKGSEVLSVRREPLSITDRAGIALDRLQRHLEEFGTIVMSAPLLVPPSPDFVFDYRHGSTNYFNDARDRVQAQAANSLRISQYLSLGLAAQFDPTMSGAFDANLQQFQSQLSQYQNSQALEEQRLNLMREAARWEYQAGIEAAMTETNSTRRSELVAEVTRRYAQSLPAGASTNFPIYPTAGGAPPKAEASLAKSPDEALKPLGDQKFTKFLGLLDQFSGDPALNNRAALVQAAGDTAVEAIFRTLGQPDKANLFKHKRVLFGVSSVSVNPGWRTRKDFAAHIGIQSGYRYREARPEVLEGLIRWRHLPQKLRVKLAKDSMTEELLSDADKAFLCLPNNGLNELRCTTDLPPQWTTLPDAAMSRQNPLVVAVSPLMDSETVDMANSYRRQDALYISLSAILTYAGLKGQADMIEQFVKQRESDVRTRSTSGIINSFSASGGLFGFEVGPRFKALEDLTDRDSKAGNILDRQSFPALIILGIDDVDITPRFTIECGKLKAWEVELTMVQSPRWVPLKAKMNSMAQSELRRLQMSLRLNEVDAALNSCDADAVPQGIMSYVQTRGRMLRFETFGSGQNQLLPVDWIVPPAKDPPGPVLPFVSAVVPTEIILARDKDDKPIKSTITVALLGKDLDKIDFKQLAVPALENLGTITLVVKSMELMQSAVTVMLEVDPTQATKAERASFGFSLALDPEKSRLGSKERPAKIISPAVRVTLSAPAVAPTLDDVFKATYKDANGTTVEHSVTIPKSATAGHLEAFRSLIEAEINREKLPASPNANVNVEVDVKK